MTHFYIIDLGYGNLPSLLRFFSNLGTVSILKSPLEFSPSSYNLTVFVLPGVGSFFKAANHLQASGFASFLLSFVDKPKFLIFGICLGMQLLASRGCEGGNATGLDLIPGSVIPISPSQTVMGWQPLTHVDSSLSQLSPFNLYDPFFYFAHSYTWSISNSSQCLAQSVYLNYPAIVSDRNVFGFQFHPELSQRSGSLLVSSILSSY